MTTITNTCHGTEYTTRKTPEQLDAICARIGTHQATPADKAIRRKIWNALCGIDGCTCGGELGERPARNWTEN